MHEQLDDNEASMAAQLQVAVEAALRNVFGGDHGATGRPSPVQPALMDKAGACVRLGVSPRTLENLIRTGRLPYVKAGRRVFFSLEALDEWIAANTVPAK